MPTLRKRAKRNGKIKQQQQTLINGPKVLLFNYYKKDQIFLNKKPTDNNPNSFWTVTVQDWYRTSLANADCPLGIFIF